MWRSRGWDSISAPPWFRILWVFHHLLREGAALTNDDVIHRSRLRLFALAGETGSVRAACRLLGVHHSTYYRWRR
jgi:hypothetical protein